VESMKEWPEVAIGKNPHEEVLKHKDEIVRRFKEILELSGFDLGYPGIMDADGGRGTPTRQWEVLELITRGYVLQPTLHRMYPDYCKGEEQPLRICPGIKFISVCEHHFAPFFGHVHIAYIPSGGKVAGLSKLPQLVEKHALRPQIQEKMTEQIACELMETCELEDVMVVIEGRHTCEIIEGYRRDAPYITSSVKGRFFSVESLRNETLHLMGLSIR